MKILVINTGSSSIKYQLFDMDRDSAMVVGLIEKIGEKKSVLSQKTLDPNGDSREQIETLPIKDHTEGLSRIVEILTHPKHGVIRDKSEITAVGHRVVHGGEQFQTSTVIDESVINAVKANIPLAPLHNPANIMGIKAAISKLPGVPNASRCE